MLNIHLNGDIVRCPDICAIQNRIQDERDQRRICKYGQHEDSCRAWQTSKQAFIKSWRLGDSGRCFLGSCKDCPKFIEQQKHGNKKKHYKIDSQVYRKLSSAAHYLVKESENKVLFITLTFGQFKRETNEWEINTLFSKYVENLRKNYNCGGYIAVREFGKLRGRVHFHLLLSIPFVSFTRLNDSWCHTIRDICEYSKNALTTDKKAYFVTNPTRALKYVCKYFAKSKGTVCNTRLVFMSRNIITRHKKYQGRLEDVLTNYKGIYIQQTSDYTTCFRITDSKEFTRFCNEFLYPFFELSYKKPAKLYSFHVDSG